MEPRQQEEAGAGIGIGREFSIGGAIYLSSLTDAQDSSVLPSSSEETNYSPTSEEVCPHLQTFSSILSRQSLKT